MSNSTLRFDDVTAPEIDFFDLVTDPAFARPTLETYDFHENPTVILSEGHCYWVSLIRTNAQGY